MAPHHLRPEHLAWHLALISRQRSVLLPKSLHKGPWHSYRQSCVDFPVMTHNRRLDFRTVVLGRWAAVERSGSRYVGSQTDGQRVRHSTPVTKTGGPDLARAVGT